MIDEELSILPRLNALVAGLALRGPISVVCGNETAYSPRSRKIIISREHIERDPEAALGAAAHEVGHELISRYHLLPAEQGKHAALWRLALNAAEDPRVNAFLINRTPGVRPWLMALDRLSPAPGDGEVHSEVLGFLLAMARADRVELPFLASLPKATRAFSATMLARDAYQHALPSTGFLPPIEAEETYYRDVEPQLVAGAPPLPFPPEKELSVRLSAAEALAIFRREIWPVVLEIAEAESGSVATALDRDGELRSQAAAVRKNSATAAKLATTILQAIRPRAGVGSKASAEAIKLSLKILESLWTASAHKAGADGFRGVSPRKPTARLPRLRSALVLEALSPERELDSVAPATVPVPNLERALKRLLPPRTPVWLSGFASGSRLDIQRALHATATGRGFETVWRRRARPKELSLAVMLLVDCSGSMAGQKIAAALAATRLLAESLRRIPACDWSVYGFQDVLIPAIRHGEGLTDIGRSRIAALGREVAGDNPAPSANNKPAFNDDGPVLLEAAAILAARPVADRLLMVISDGSPSGCRSKPEDLKVAVVEVSKMPGMTLVGLGLGEAGTEAVAEYYPRSEVNIELAKLGATVGRLLCRAFRAARTDTQTNAQRTHRHERSTPSCD